MADSTACASEPDLVANFLQRYDSREQEYYRQVASHVSKICKEFLREKSIEANVTYRAKSISSLRNKLYTRVSTHIYQSEDEITNELSDLAGIRIALFFPHQKTPVREFIERTFDILENVVHPKDVTPSMEDKDLDAYNRRYIGYQANHIRARFKPESAPIKFKGKIQFEIQVQSVLQSAWAEVEHDIIYKQLKGPDPTEPERTMLDGLNGLVSIGELYLEQLNAIYEDRVLLEQEMSKPFTDIYELGNFLSCKMRESLERDSFDIRSVKLLRKFLKLGCVNLNTKNGLNDKLLQFGITTSLHSSFQNPQESKSNLSLVIMERLYLGHDSGLQVQAQQYKPPSSKDRCGILVSTIISLDELFSPVSFWGQKLFGTKTLSRYPGSSSNLPKLEWLMKSNDVKKFLLGDIDKLGQMETQIVQEFWDWLEIHPSEIVRFVFSISKLGVLRDFPSEISLLHAISGRFEEHLELEAGIE